MSKVEGHRRSSLGLLTKSHAVTQQQRGKSASRSPPRPPPSADDGDPDHRGPCWLFRGNGSTLSVERANSCDGWIGLGPCYEPILDGVSVSSEWAYSEEEVVLSCKKGDVYEGVFGRGLNFHW